jgi:hypothetical protein
VRYSGVENDEKEEQPARLSPAAAIAMTRRMIDPLFEEFRSD